MRFVSRLWHALTITVDTSPIEPVIHSEVHDQAELLRREAEEVVALVHRQLSSGIWQRDMMYGHYPPQRRSDRRD